MKVREGTWVRRAWGWPLLRVGADESRLKRGMLLAGPFPADETLLTILFSVLHLSLS